MKLPEKTTRGSELDRLRLKTRLLNHILENQRQRELRRRFATFELIRPLSQPFVAPSLDAPAAPPLEAG